MTELVKTGKKDKKKSALASWVYPEAKKIDPDILERRRRVAICWNQLGLSVQKTAEHLGFSAPTISKDRQWLLKMWTTIVSADIVEIVSREISKLEVQESELWAAWETSKEDEVKTTTERKTNASGDLLATFNKTERTNRIPEVKFMDGILRCQERRSKLLGLDKAVTFEGATFSFSTFVEKAYTTNQAFHAKEPKELEPDVIDVTPLELKKGDGRDGEFKATSS